MTSKHTPGPWQVEYDGPSNPIIVTKHAPFDILAHVLTPGIGEDCTIGNAQLIAAAPELLALLNKFIEMDIPCPFRGNDGRLKDFVEWYKNVKAAIAKAEGCKVRT